MKKMPVIFSGHGSPMIALAHNDLTAAFNHIGQEVISRFGKPKAILSICAHWYADGTYIQSAEKPRQIYDMYGFPNELYEVQYPVSGNRDLTMDVLNLLGDKVSINDTWGIDHGTWTVLVHMFPKADIPVVQLSVNRRLTEEECYNLGKELAPLREKGYLIFASGNVVHNLRELPLPMRLMNSSRRLYWPAMMRQSFIMTPIKMQIMRCPPKTTSSLCCTPLVPLKEKSLWYTITSVTLAPCP